jgi:2-(1,2-epoxy-1,2-dihydrophenyl)acetyl-CoA isomerase
MTSDILMTGTDDLGAELASGVLTLTLNRPDARNALTPAMIVALGDQLALAEVNDQVRCVVLTGAGKAFCSGGDVKAMAADEISPGLDTKVHLQRLAQRRTAGQLFRMPKPTIAVVNGAAAGAGLALALACDLRIMSNTAFLMTAFARVGLSGDFGGAYFLTALVGAAKAREFFYLSDRIPAEEALRLGLTNWVCPPGDLQTQTSEITRRLADGPSLAFRYMKENLNRAIEADRLEACMDIEVTHHVRCFDTQHHQAAALAFSEKREPLFVGR